MPTEQLPYFDLSSPAFDVAGPDVLAAREASWCARTNYGYAVLRYDAVKELLREPRLRQGGVAWPEDNGVTGGLLLEWWKAIITHREGDDHRRLRRLVNPILSRSAMEALVPYFGDLADELIAEFEPNGRCEFIGDFAEPYAARILCRVIGLPDSDWRDLAAWSTDLMLAFGSAIRTEMPRIENAIASIYGHVDQVIASEGSDTPVDRLVEAERSGALSHAELQALIAALIFGGMDTTKNQLGLAMRLFAQHPDQWAALAADPSLAGNAVEETMRFAPTVTWITRLATEDFEYRGLEITAGTTLHLLTYPADTDPLVVEDPKFDITTERERHLVFGGGAHHCLGHFLARFDMAEALPRLAQRMPGLRSDGEPTMLPNSGITGATELPLKFGSRARTYASGRA